MARDLRWNNIQIQPIREFDPTQFVEMMSKGVDQVIGGLDKLGNRQRYQDQAQAAQVSEFLEGTRNRLVRDQDYADKREDRKYTLDTRAAEEAWGSVSGELMTDAYEAGARSPDDIKTFFENSPKYQELNARARALGNTNLFNSLTAGVKLHDDRAEAAAREADRRAGRANAAAQLGIQNRRLTWEMDPNNPSNIVRGFQAKEAERAAATAAAEEKRKNYGDVDAISQAYLLNISPEIDRNLFEATGGTYSNMSISDVVKASGHGNTDRLGGLISQVNFERAEQGLPALSNGEINRMYMMGVGDYGSLNPFKWNADERVREAGRTGDLARREAEWRDYLYERAKDGMVLNPANVKKAREGFDKGEKEKTNPFDLYSLPMLAEGQTAPIPNWSTPRKVR